MYTNWLSRCLSISLSLSSMDVAPLATCSTAIIILFAMFPCCSWRNVNPRQGGGACTGSCIKVSAKQCSNTCFSQNYQIQYYHKVGIFWGIKITSKFGNLWLHNTCILSATLGCMSTSTAIQELYVTNVSYSKKIPLYSSLVSYLGFPMSFNIFFAWNIEKKMGRPGYEAYYTVCFDYSNALTHQGSWPLLSKHASSNMLTQQFQWLNIVLHSFAVVLQAICAFWTRSLTTFWLRPFATPTIASSVSRRGAGCRRCSSGCFTAACHSEKLGLSQTPYQRKTNTDP